MQTRPPAAVLACAALCAALACAPSWAEPTARFITNYGSFDVELFASQSPETVAGFLARVRQGYYRGTLFHRLVPGVLLQGGAYDSQWRLKGTGEAASNESDDCPNNAKWSMAMTTTDAGRRSSAEFIINLGDNDDFDKGTGGAGRYTCVFGEISEGHDTVRAMLNAGVISGGDFIGDRPLADLILEDVLLINDN